MNWAGVFVVYSTPVRGKIREFFFFEILGRKQLGDILCES